LIARGVGTILSAPLSSALLGVSGFGGAKGFGFAYGMSGYVCILSFSFSSTQLNLIPQGPLILFTGLVLLLSVSGTMWDYFDKPEHAEVDGVATKIDDSKTAKVQQTQQQFSMVYLPRPSAYVAFPSHLRTARVSDVYCVNSAFLKNSKLA
jgi:hypothetical protein